MATIFRRLSVVSFAASLIALVVGAVRFHLGDVVGPIQAGSSTSTPRGPIEPSSVSVDLGSVAKGSRTPFAITIANVTSRRARVVGVPSLCVRAGCVRAIDPPAWVESNRAATIHFELEDDGFPALVDLETEIFLDFDDPTGVTVPVRVHASIVDVPPVASTLPGAGGL